MSGFKKTTVYLVTGALAAATTLFFFGESGKKQTIADMAKTSVTVTTPRGGGTGIILKSTSSFSHILTNNHVCKLIAKGGVVTSDSGDQYQVFSYKTSNLHDLCLITVAADLGIQTAVANDAPKLYEEASIAGHPALFPSVITKGHFSGKLPITIMIGLKECTDEEKHNNNAILCFFLGGLPVLKKYEAQLVTGTIMAGSSGSAVYNNKGELTNLVFAGTEGLSYALTVPYEYVKTFLDKEVNTLVDQFPENTTTLSLNAESTLEDLKKIIGALQ